MVGAVSPDGESKGTGFNSGKLGSGSAWPAGCFPTPALATWVPGPCVAGDFASFGCPGLASLDTFDDLPEADCVVVSDFMMCGNHLGQMPK